MIRASLMAAVGAVTVAVAGCGAPAASPVDAPQPVSTSSTSSAAPTPAPTTSTSSPAPTFDLKPSDFKLGIKVTRQKCFGSAGCNVTFHIDPEFRGQTFLLPKTGTTYATYEVKGGKQPMTNTFTVTGTSIHYDGEETTETAKSEDTLTAEVTSLEYRP